MTNIPINVRQGFLVHWCEEFIHHFGEGSEFVRAVSDLYTIKVATMMERTGNPVPKDELGLFSTDDAVECIRELISTNEDVGKILYKEAFGTESIGSIQTCINNGLGSGTFERWIKYFEKNDFDECLKLVKNVH